MKPIYCDGRRYMSGRTWKEELGARIPEDLGREIDIFETEIGWRSQNKLEIFTI